MKIPIFHNCNIEVEVDVQIEDVVSEMVALVEDKENHWRALSALAAAVRIAEGFPYSKIRAELLREIAKRFEAIAAKTAKAAEEAKAGVA